MERCKRASHGKKVELTEALASVHTAVDKLTESPIVEMRKQAEATQATIKGSLGS